LPTFRADTSWSFPLLLKAFLVFIIPKPFNTLRSSSTLIKNPVTITLLSIEPLGQSFIELPTVLIHLPYVYFLPVLVIPYYLPPFSRIYCIPRFYHCKAAYLWEPMLVKPYVLFYIKTDFLTSFLAFIGPLEYLVIVHYFEGLLHNAIVSSKRPLC